MALEKYSQNEIPTSTKFNTMVDQVNENTNSISAEITRAKAAEETNTQSITDLGQELSSHEGNTSNPHNVTKAQVGLGNVDNTSDTDKPISTATQAALDTLTKTTTELGLKTSELDYNQEQLITDDKAVPDYSALPLLCGQPPILYGAGTPQEAVVPINWNQFDAETGEGYNWNGEPSALGQVYINISVTSGGRYTAIPSGTDNVELKWVNF